MAQFSSNDKKKSLPPIKKYNPDIDIVPFSVNGFGIYTSTSDIVIEFHSNTPNRVHQVCVGSFSLGDELIKNLIERLQLSLKEKEKKIND